MEKSTSYHKVEASAKHKNKMGVGRTLSDSSYYCMLRHCG